MQTEKTVFAFKLATKQQALVAQRETKWQAREGVALAGCSDPVGFGDYRESNGYNRDGGVYC